MMLQRPIFKWLLFASCVGLFVTAMAWVTGRMISLDQQHEASEREAQVQERMRLALWRMDSLVSALLIRENSRPPSHYQSFHSPEDLFSNRSQRELPKGEAVMPSPLLGEPPEFVRLHFQMMQGMAASPQVPTGKDLSLANNWYVISPQLETAKQRLAQLSAILQRHPDALLATQERQDAAPSPPAPRPTAAAGEPPPDTPSLLKASVAQENASKQELQQRVQLNNINFNTGRLSPGELPKKKQAETSTTASSTLSRGASAPAAPAAVAMKVATAGNSTLARDEKFKDKEADTRSRAAALSPPAPAQPVAVSVAPSDLKPRWLEDELLLVRTAMLDGQNRQQGLWLDWPRLRTRLLETISDLLPHAELSATDPAWLDASSMVTLPVRLLPGKVAVTIGDPSLLRRSLSLAWACFLFAATAIGVVLNRAIVLSERRGAFVSAVTHELRTPLTTFQLYSEMLADDMVPDAAKRREYLRTLCDESTRLTHLVENVLSYSRIERGRAAARRETVMISDFVARVEPRLRLRANQVGLDLQVNVAAAAGEIRINVDSLAVEQILFNLVDNACKYAAPSSTDRALHVEVNVERGYATFRVRDHGPGLSKQQMKRLFRPFEKSATEAAHSAPGVGLGLALCRRLARDLGGDLVVESHDQGACFKLTVSLAD